MPIHKFQTVGRNTHRHGRLSCLLDIDVQHKKLFVYLLEGRGLGTGTELNDPNAHIMVRTALLPSKNLALVQQVRNTARRQFSSRVDPWSDSRHRGLGKPALRRRSLIMTGTFAMLPFPVAAWDRLRRR